MQHVRPRVDHESHAAALDRNELGALLVAAGLRPPPGHALISLRSSAGLRVSEATGADIEHLGLERGHRTLTITRKRRCAEVPAYHRYPLHALHYEAGEQGTIMAVLTASQTGTPAVEVPAGASLCPRW